MIGRLKKVPLSEMYGSGGATGLSSWLQQNIDVLNEAVDLSLTRVEDEQGSSSADVIAKDGAGQTVVIENQLDASGDGALGKLIMGMASVGSRAGIWIVGDSNEQHVSAVSWLNENAPNASFYLLTVEAYRIDDSPPAPVMNLAAGPAGSSEGGSNGGGNPLGGGATNTATSGGASGGASQSGIPDSPEVLPEDTYVSGDPAAGQEPYISGDPSAGEDPVTYISGDPSAGEEDPSGVPASGTDVGGSQVEAATLGGSSDPDAGSGDATRRFWTGLLEKARERTRIHGETQPSDESVIGANAGLAGLDYNYVLGDHGSSVELYIDRGEGREGENETIFNALSATQDAIEYNFGGDLNWQSAENSPARRVEANLGTGGLQDEDRWPETQKAMVDAMIRLERALRSHIARIQI